MRLNRIHVGLAAVCLVAAGLATVPSAVWAAPYASNVNKTGVTVNFLLNEPADSLTYKINGGAPISLDGTTKGGKTFNLNAATDTFSIIAEKNAAVGYTIPTGVIIPPDMTAATPPTLANGLSQPTMGGGLNIISDDSNQLLRALNLRGLDVNRSPNTANFGTIYYSIGSNGTVGAPSSRATTDGLYAVRADGTDAFGYGDTGQNPNNTVDGFPAFNTTVPPANPSGTNSPYRITVAPNGEVYVADYSDLNGWAFVMPANLSSATNLLKDFGGPSPVGTTADGTGLPVGQNHGSISSLHAEGSLAGGNLVLYGVDEDLNSAHVGIDTVQNDRNSLWRWDIGGSANSTVTPVKIFGSNTTGLIGDFPAGGITVDMTRGADGKFYLSQARSTTVATLTRGLVVVDDAGTVLFDSLAASRTLLNDPAARDILTWINGIAVSPDQKWLAATINSSDVLVLPLVNGIPDLANRLLVDSAAVLGENSGRDVTFDAAGNILYASSGQGRIRVLAPGGHTKTTLDFNGTSYAFSSVTIPTTPTNDADFNDDTKVDALDLALWAGTFGGAATATTGDANGDNLATGEDFLLWQQQYKNAAAAATVPEPANWCSAAVAALILATVAAPRRRAALQRAAS